MRLSQFVLIFLLALMTRILNLLVIEDIQTFAFIEDSRMYWDIGSCINEFGYFCNFSGEGFGLETERVPLYPLFISIHLHFWESAVISVLVSQAIIDSINAMLVALLGSRFGSWVGIISGIVYAISHNFILHSSLILPETFAIFLFLSFMLLTLNLRQFAIRSVLGWLVIGLLTGVFAGLLVLSKIVFQFVVLVGMVVGIASVKGKFCRLSYIVMFVIGFGASLFPLVERNIKKFDSYSLSSQTGTHALFWVVGNCISLDEGSSFSSVTKPLKDAFYDDLVSRGIDYQAISPFELSSLKVGFAASRAAQLDVDVILKCWSFGAVKSLIAPSLVVDQRIRQLNTGSFYESSGSGLFDKIYGFVIHNNSVYVASLIVGSFVSMVSLSLAAVGVVVGLRTSRWDVLCFLGITGIFLLISGPVGGAKYRILFEPFVLILAAVGALAVYRYYKRGPVSQIKLKGIDERETGSSS